MKHREKLKCERLIHTLTDEETEQTKKKTNYTSIQNQRRQKNKAVKYGTLEHEKLQCETNTHRLT